MPEPCRWYCLAQLSQTIHRSSPSSQGLWHSEQIHCSSEAVPAAVANAVLPIGNCSGWLEELEQGCDISRSDVDVSGVLEVNVDG